MWIFARALAVTASATPFAVGPCDALYVGGAGTVTVLLQDGSTAAIPFIAGGWLPIKAVGVTNVGSATGVFALYR